MMNDEEILRLAAVAYGYPISDGHYASGYWYYLDGGELPDDGAWTEVWNPLLDDGDAFKLMHRLNLSVTYHDLGGRITIHRMGDDALSVLGAEFRNGETTDDVRLAVTEFAAEIGKLML